MKPSRSVVPSVTAGASLPRADLAFFRRPADVVAEALLGAIMVRETDECTRRARVIEVEAYLGPRDLASHSSKGRTPRTEVMFGPPGRAYVYFVYGMHWLFNVVCGEEGGAQAVLLRGAEPLDGWSADLTGPAKLAKAFRITGAQNRADLINGEVFFVHDASHRPKLIRTPRIGVDYAKHWKNRLLRFVDISNPASKKLGLPRKQ